MMDYGKMSLGELKNGYHYEKEQEAYVCNYCGQTFQAGQVFQIDGSFYMAEPAAARHIKSAHNGSLAQLLYADTKYNTLTGNQKELLALFYAGASDREMARQLNVTEATIRRQRFTFREKAKQAKFYLAVYEQIFENPETDDDEMIPIHNHAVYVDDRYLITCQEREKIIEAFFSSTEPLVLKTFTSREKKKVVILGKIAKQFETGRKYSEKEVNEILKPIYEDYTEIRRYLIMYGFMERTKDGTEYWLTS